MRGQKKNETTFYSECGGVAAACSRGGSCLIRCSLQCDGQSENPSSPLCKLAKASGNESAGFLQSTKSAASFLVPGHGLGGREFLIAGVGDMKMLSPVRGRGAGDWSQLLV